MRKFIKIIFILALAYFVVGFAIAKFNLLPDFSYQTYLEFSSIAGGIASVFGLLALGAPALTTKNLKELDLELLKKVANLAGDMKKVDDEILKRSSEIEKADDEILRRSSELDQLEQKKKRTELLVRKASMVLFLKERYKNNADKLIETYRENEDIGKRLSALNEEIELSGDQKLTKEIIEFIESKTEEEEKRSCKEKSFAESINSWFYIKPTFLGVGFDLNALLDDLIKRNKKKE